jgi:hypothetical protein
MQTNLCILIEISASIRMAKKLRALIVSCVTNSEFHFTHFLALVHLIPSRLVWAEIECTVHVALQKEPKN